MKNILSALVVAGVLIVAGLFIMAHKPGTPVASGPTSATAAHVSIKGVSGPAGAAAGALAGSKTITWEASGYPAGLGVNINLIRKTGDNPATYTLVRAIAVNTANDGSETWTPMAQETGTDLYIEVTCSNTHQFDKGCQSSPAIRAN